MSRRTDPIYLAKKTLQYSLPGSVEWQGAFDTLKKSGQYDSKWIARQQAQATPQAVATKYSSMLFDKGRLNQPIEFKDAVSANEFLAKYGLNTSEGLSKASQENTSFYKQSNSSAGVAAQEAQIAKQNAGSGSFVDPNYKLKGYNPYTGQQLTADQIGKPIKATGVPVASQSATNLWEFYTKQGQNLPSVQQRAPLYTQYGGTGTYTGTAEQNTFLLGKLKGGLPPTKVTDNAGSVTTNPSPQFPTSNPTPTGNTTNATAAAAGAGILNDTSIANYLQNLANFEGQKKTLIGKLMGTLDDRTSIADTRADLENQYNIKAKLAEIDSLGTRYNNTKAHMDTEVSNVTDQLATTGFISRAAAAIERRYAPELNRISAEINFKTGLLTKSQELIQQAVSDILADQKYDLDQAKMFYELNIDIIDGLENNYKDAYKIYLAQQEDNYNRTFDEKKLIADLAEKNPGAGISLSDSYQSALSKFTAAGGTITKSSGGTVGERTVATLSEYGSVMVPGTKTPDGTPIIDSNGYVTPLAWKQLIEDALSSGLTRESFIKQFGYLLYRDPKTNSVSPNYGLTPNEILLIAK